MKDLSILHFVIIFIFIAAIVIAFLIFSGVLPGLRDNSFRNLNSPILFWGTLPEQVIRPIIDDFQDEQSNNILVEYTQFDEDTYLKTILNALAEGNGPDVWILPQQKFIEHSTKILFLGPKSFPERLFREQFFDGADIFLWPPGRIAAVPFYTDQLVLFWSREHFRSAGIAAPPKNWSGFLDASMRLTKKDSAQTIIQAGAALGNFANNNNAKDVVTLFMLQSKSPITYISTTGSGENLRANLRSALGDSAYADTFTTISSSIRFFDQFADPRKTSYSWPRSMGGAQD
ncbi:MAG: extracellular solute-binding protein, partial [Candidatus Niyogibacteria bacterium]|nr:extracellular solute-binding protein [Candidatus Niyogibacteria bacterium]